MDERRLKNVLEAALFAAGRPLGLAHLQRLFEPQEAPPTRDEIRQALTLLEAECGERGVELVQVAGGYRYQVRESLVPWVGRLWEERPQKYSRALLETLALIVYRQPITRAEIEEVRGVAVSSNIIKTLMERDWVVILGHKEVPGRPALYGSTRRFLDDFNLKSLDELPSLMEVRDLEEIATQLELDSLADPSPADGEDLSQTVTSEDPSNPDSEAESESVREAGDA